MAGSVIRRVKPSPPGTLISAPAGCATCCNTTRKRMSLREHVTAFVDREFARETAFLAELVKVPSDNPPGDCAAHAARAKELLTGLGFEVEVHKVTEATV